MHVYKLDKKLIIKHDVFNADWRAYIASANVTIHAYSVFKIRN